MSSIPHSAAAYAETFQSALDQAQAFADSMTKEQFNWSPEPEKWSVAQCIQHLVIVNSDYLDAFNTALGKGGPKGTPPFNYGFLGRWFIGMISPEMKRTMKTPAVMNPIVLTPEGGFEQEAVMSDFRAACEGIIAVCQRAEGLDLTKIRVASPFMKMLKLQIGAFLEGNAGHCLRHLNQAQRVIEHPNFPAGN